MSELSSVVHYRGYRLEFTSGLFYDCDITLGGAPKGGVLAAAVSTTPELFVQRCKETVDKLCAPSAVERRQVKN